MVELKPFLCPRYSAIDTLIAEFFNGPFTSVWL